MFWSCFDSSPQCLLLKMLPQPRRGAFPHGRCFAAMRCAHTHSELLICKRNSHAFWIHFGWKSAAPERYYRGLAEVLCRSRLTISGMGSQHSAAGTAVQPFNEVLPQDLVCSVLACLHNPITRVHAQLVCKAWRTSMALSLQDVRICAGGATCLRQLEWLLTQGEENAQQLQVLEVQGLSPKETWNPTIASSSCLSKVLAIFTGLRKLVLLPGCNLDVSLRHVLQLKDMPELEDLQLVYHRGATAQLGQPNTLVEFAALRNLCRLVLHLAGPSETVVLAPEWSNLTKLTELSLEGIYAMPRGTGVLEVLMQRLEKMTIKAKNDIWLPLHAPLLRIANLDYFERRLLGLGTRETLEFMEHANVWLRWPKLQQLTLGPAFPAAAINFCLRQRALEGEVRLLEGTQNLRSLSMHLYPGFMRFPFGDCLFQGLTLLHISDYLPALSKPMSGAQAVWDFAEFSALHGLRELDFSVHPCTMFGLSEQLSALSVLSCLTITHDRRSLTAPVPTLVGKLPAFPRLNSLVLDGIRSCTSLSFASLRHFKVRWTGEESSSLPKLNGPCFGKLTSLEMLGVHPHVEAKYLWSLPHMKRIKIVFASSGRHRICDNGVYDLLQALLSLPALKEVHINALTLGPTVLPPLQLFELLDHLTIACNCLGFGEQLEHSPVGYGVSRSASFSRGADGLSSWVVLHAPADGEPYILGSQYVCSDRWEGPPSAHLFLMTPKKAGKPMWRKLRDYAPLTCHEAGDYHNDFRENVMYEWKLGPPHPLDGDHHTMAATMEDHVVGLAAKYGISAYGIES